MKDLHQLAVTVRNTAKHLALNFDHTNITTVHKLNLMANELEAMQINQNTKDRVKQSLEQVLQDTVWDTTNHKKVYDPINCRIITHKIRKITDTPTTEQIKGKDEPAQNCVHDHNLCVNYGSTPMTEATV